MTNITEPIFIMTTESQAMKRGTSKQFLVSVFRNFKKGALQTIQFKAVDTDHWITVFARTGNKVKLMDTDMFLNMEIGDINQNWSTTNLYSQTNYNLAGARTWADKAFTVNKPVYWNF